MRLRLEKSEKCFAKINIKWDSSKVADKPRDWTVRVINDWTNSDEAKKVTKAIEDAQEHILTRYGDDKSGVSTDIIEIEVYSKDCVDLTLIDLPGLVRTVSKNERTELIDEIRSLINDYLRNERCIILAIVPANVDFHNSQILADAKTVDPDTRRTIPVITKPDTIGEGSEMSVRKLLLGEETDFALGFHMCKCRSQKELDEGVTLQQSLKKEGIYFNVTEPWRSEENKSLFGVANLSNKLATLQVKMIQDSMPSIISEISKEKKKAVEDLKQLGHETADVYQMRGIFDKFKDELVVSMKSIYEGRADENDKLSKALSDEKGYSWCSVLKEENGNLADEILQEKLNNVTEQVQDGKTVIVSNSGSYFEGTVVDMFFRDDDEFVHIDPSDPVYKSSCFASATAFDPLKYPTSNTSIGVVLRFKNNKSYKVISDSQWAAYKEISTDLVQVSNKWLKQN